MDDSIAYIGLDVHSRTCSLSWIDGNGDPQSSWTFRTSEEQLIKQIRRIPAQEKTLTFEEGPLAYWTARTLAEEVDEILVCDPRKNYLISRSVRKDDEPDARALARLLRMGELEEVYQPADDRRALYKQACKHYLDLRDQQRRLKHKIKSRLKRWGLWNIPTMSVYSKSGRTAYLEELPHERIRTEMESLYRMLDQAHEEKQLARKELLELGGPFGETQEFQKIPGIGPISAHTFDAIIQTPHRFATKQKLWRYCKLGIRKQSSGGGPIRGEHLDPAGHGELKSLSHRAVRQAIRTSGENEVEISYQASFERTEDKTHARLNTQRTVLATMWGLWKRGKPYDPELFLG